ncbi:hypothetical protein BXT84_14065 [Sulfobacillus thermotolerans]|uniref:FtsK domain-containing protein n=1 Tax=Sulfobacillus thermotolerans TaxID=338644 RepID=A0ABM6RUB9_9FIRM|nr:hypothetical protein BXT84_14065 [Sulfobacillus thermotolerans]
MNYHRSQFFMKVFHHFGRRFIVFFIVTALFQIIEQIFFFSTDGIFSMISIGLLFFWNFLPPLSSLSNLQHNLWQRFQAQMDTVRNVHQPPIILTNDDWRQIVNSFQYKMSDKYAENHFFRNWIIALFVTIIGTGLFVHSVLGDVLVGLAFLFLTYFSLNKTNRARTALQEAFPDLDWVQVHHNENDQALINIAIQVLISEQTFDQLFPWTTPQYFPKEIMIKAITMMMHSQWHRIIFSQTLALMHDVQRIFDESEKNIITIRRTETRKNSQGEDEKYEVEERQRLITLKMTNTGFTYELNPKAEPGTVDRLIRQIRSERIQAILSHYNEQNSIVKWHFDLGYVTVDTEFQREAVYADLVGQTEPAPTEEEPIFVPENDTPTTPVFDPHLTLYPGGPSLALLAPPKSEKNATNEGFTMKKALDAALRDQGLSAVESQIVGIGATVGVFDLIPPPNFDPTVLVKKSEAIRLASRGKLAGLRIYAGDEGLRAEILRPHRAAVSFASILFEISRMKKMALPMCLGTDAVGNPVIVDLAEAPHLLIAGTTGSGKSIAAHAMLLSLLFSLPTDEIQLILIDPKKVELSIYKTLSNVSFLSNSQDVDAKLSEIVDEMEKRNEAFETVGARNISSYIAKTHQKLQRIVIYIDEANDLFLGAESAVPDKKEGKELRQNIENSLTRLAQKARSAGIHLIVATQKPSVESVPSLLRGNLPSRLAMTVGTTAESLVALDEPGAETLAGKGDALLKLIGTKPRRVQIAFITEDEVENVVNWFTTHQALQALQAPHSEDKEEKKTTPAPFQSKLDAVENEMAQTQYSSNFDLRKAELTQKMPDPSTRKVFSIYVRNAFFDAQYHEIKAMCEKHHNDIDAESPAIQACRIFAALKLLKATESVPADTEKNVSQDDDNQEIFRKNVEYYLESLREFETYANIDKYELKNLAYSLAEGKEIDLVYIRNYVTTDRELSEKIYEKIKEINNHAND